MKRVRIFPEWNVNDIMSYESGYAEKVRIFPEWNLNHLSTKSKS